LKKEQTFVPTKGNKSMKSFYLVSIIFFVSSVLGMNDLENNVKNFEDMTVFRDKFDQFNKVAFKPNTRNMQALFGFLNQVWLEDCSFKFINNHLTNNPNNDLNNNSKTGKASSKNKKSSCKKNIKKQTFIPKRYYCGISGCPIYSLWPSGQATHRLSHWDEQRKFICPKKDCHGAFLTSLYVDKHIKLIHTRQN
jgi:hypothetical protein